jgi:hypothetical protein
MYIKSIFLTRSLGEEDVAGEGGQERREKQNRIELDIIVSDIFGVINVENHINKSARLKRLTWTFVQSVEKSSEAKKIA